MITRLPAQRIRIHNPALSDPFRQEQFLRDLERLPGVTGVHSDPASGVLVECDSPETLPPRLQLLLDRASVRGATGRCDSKDQFPQEGLADALFRARMARNGASPARAPVSITHLIRHLKQALGLR